MRIVILIALVAILGCLAAAVVYMLRRPGATTTMSADELMQLRSRQMAKALSWRIGISIGIFLLIMLSWYLGWLEPGGVPMVRR